MKQVMKILGVAVGFILMAAVIILSVTYFNRGKKVVTDNAEGVLGIVENETAISDLIANDGTSITGTQVASMIESLPTNNIDIPIVVFTNGGKTVAEYTKTGATAPGSIDFVPDTATYRGTSLSNLVSVGITPATGNYRVTTDNTYINPKVSYSVTCYYTDNLALNFIVIVQQSNTPTT